MKHHPVTIRQDLHSYIDGGGIWIRTIVCSCGNQTHTDEEYQEHQAQATGHEMAEAILSALKTELKEADGR